MNELQFGAVFKRDDYLEGIVVNADGQRFFDEGADIRALTYAKLGRAILAQPGQVAWQIFDKHGAARLHGEYRVKQSARTKADTVEALVAQLDGMKREACLANIAAFNAAVRTDIPYDPGKKDGRCTQGLAIPKSNWALAIAEPPVRHHRRMSHRDLFGSPALPDGFDYQPDVLSADEERQLVASFEQLPFAPFDFHGFLGKRRIVRRG